MPQVANRSSIYKDSLGANISSNFLTDLNHHIFYFTDPFTRSVTQWDL